MVPEDSCSCDITSGLPQIPGNLEKPGKLHFWAKIPGKPGKWHFFQGKERLNLENLENQYFLFFAPNNAKNDYTKIYNYTPKFQPLLTKLFLPLTYLS